VPRHSRFDRKPRTLPSSADYFTTREIRSSTRVLGPLLGGTPFHHPLSAKIVLFLLQGRKPGVCGKNKKNTSDDSRDDSRGLVAPLEQLKKKWTAEGRAGEDNSPPIDPPASDSARLLLSVVEQHL
jgi:hypothetical protein